MDYKARISSKKIIASGFIFLFMAFFLSLVINIIQGINNYRLQNEKQIIVTPMAYNAPFSVSMNAAGSEALRMWALTFSTLRLNVSPETVDAQYDFFLSFVRPNAQQEFTVQLAEEARKIKQGNVTSAFYPTGFKVFPNSSRVEIRGYKDTWIGNSKPIKESKRYILELAYDGGVAYLTRFIEAEDGKK